MAETITESLRAFDTPVLADALSRLNLKSHSEGYAAPGLHCFASPHETVVGYAATARIRTADPPMTGHHYFRHSRWWEELSQLPAPRVVVIEDIDREPGSGACVGLIGASIFQALNCVGAITNGAVRDVPGIAKTNFGLFAAYLSPSYAYAHLVDYGQTVTIFNLAVQQGDLLAADRHGVVSIPVEHAGQVCAIAADLHRRKQTFVDFCRSSRFSLNDLDQELKEIYLP
ncbi:MAG: RraA family protein [Acidobacteriota bacterium]|nr:RraA family protein [Acidobacteriota bacterium]